MKQIKTAPRAGATELSWMLHRQDDFARWERGLVRPRGRRKAAAEPTKQRSNDATCRPLWVFSPREHVSRLPDRPCYRAAAAGDHKT